LRRALIELGHEVRLLPPAHVKPYVRRNKNDAAIYEAAVRPGQRAMSRANRSHD
jgi:transposase